VAQWARTCAGGDNEAESAGSLGTTRWRDSVPERTQDGPGYPWDTSIPMTNGTMARSASAGCPRRVAFFLSQLKE
jgi:hypothetical protein